MAQLRDYRPLRLMAGDTEDLAVISAALQDAVLKVGDMAYMPHERRFAFVANRFLWECATGRTRGPFGRVRVGVHIDDVVAVRQSRLRLEAKSAVLSVLSFRCDRDEQNDRVVITIDFSGGAAIQLEAEAVNVSVSDISPPWKTAHKPTHALSGDGVE